MENLEQPVNDVPADSSSASGDASLSSGIENKSNLSSIPESKPIEPPFHEHPRWKERTEELNTLKRELSEKSKEYERQLGELRSKVDRPSDQAPTLDEAKLLARLKGIDPEFAQYQESLKKEIEGLRQWKAQAEQQNYLNSARAIAEKVQSELKVDPALHAMYLTQIPMGTPVDKVSEAYKAIHDKVNTVMEARERAALSKYSEAKKADVKAPATNKGHTSKPSPAKFQYSKDKNEALSQLAKNVAGTLRNSKAS